MPHSARSIRPSGVWGLDPSGLRNGEGVAQGDERECGVPP